MCSDIEDDYMGGDEGPAATVSDLAEAIRQAEAFGMEDAFDHDQGGHPLDQHHPCRCCLLGNEPRPAQAAQHNLSLYTAHHSSDGDYPRSSLQEITY